MKLTEIAKLAGIILLTGTFVISLYHFGFHIGGGMEIPENMTQAEIDQLEEKMKLTVLKMVYVAVGIVCAVTFIPMVYRRWSGCDHDYERKKEWTGGALELKCRKCGKEKTVIPKGG